jgi:hypothetical protein
MKYCHILILWLWNQLNVLFTIWIFCWRYLCYICDTIILFAMSICIKQFNPKQLCHYYFWQMVLICIQCSGKMAGNKQVNKYTFIILCIIDKSWHIDQLKHVCVIYFMTVVYVYLYVIPAVSQFAQEFYDTTQVYVLHPAG